MANVKRLIPTDEKSILVKCLSGKVEFKQGLKDREAKGSFTHACRAPDSPPIKALPTQNFICLFTSHYPPVNFTIHEGTLLSIVSAGFLFNITLQRTFRVSDPQ